MSVMVIAYKGASSDDLYTAYFDGASWHGNSPIRDQFGGITPKSTRNPGAAQFKDKLYLAYKGASSNHLYIASYDGEQWSGDVRIQDQPGGISPQSDDFPTLCVFAGTESSELFMYMIYKGVGTDDLYLAWFDGNSWYGDVKISSIGGTIHPRTTQGVRTAVFNTTMYIVYKGVSTDDLYIAFFDGKTWYGNTKISDQPGGISPKAASNPGLGVCYVSDTTAVEKGTINSLCIVYQDPSNALNFTYFDGAKWYPIKKLADDIDRASPIPESNYSPAVMGYAWPLDTNFSGGSLYMIYKRAHSDHLCSAFFDGSRWNGNTNISDQPGGITPQSAHNPQPIELTISFANLLPLQNLTQLAGGSGGQHRLCCRSN